MSYNIINYAHVREFHMRVIKYAKYNRTKAPQFQTKTLIIQDGTKTYVEKSALCDETLSHIGSFDKKYKELKKTYVNVRPVEAVCTGNTVRFDFVSGRGVVSAIDDCMNDIDRLVDKIKYYLERIFVYSPESESDWCMTDEFRKIFGEVSFNKNLKAVCPANIDAIFDNFLEDGNIIHCIDYEWTFDFPVPQKYIIYRTLFYYFNNNRIYLEKKISEEDFFAKFGFDSEMLEAFWIMEDNFQQYAHGKGRKYIYTNNYVKTNANLTQIVKNPDNAAEFLKKDAEIIELNGKLRETLDDALAAHEKLKSVSDELTQTHARLHDTIEELTDTHEKLHMTTDELLNTHEKLSAALDEIREKDRHIANYQAAVARYHRMLRNPFFAVSELTKKAAGKGKRTAKKTMSKVLPPVVRRGLSVWKNEGFDVFVYKVKNRKKYRNEYQLWIEQNENNLQYTETLQYNPLISVVVPVYNVADSMLRECIDSVINQTYKNWELCLVDDCSTMESVRKVLSEYEGRERIKIKYRSENGHISRATNDGIELASGEFIGLMDCDDLLAPNALYEMARMLNSNKNYDFIYSDEDKINEEGTERRDPFFKPDWSPDTFMSYMYTCHFSIFRKSLMDELGRMRVGYEGSQDYDLVLRVMEKTRNIGHVPKILYHWRTRKESTANDLTAKPYIIESTIKAKTDALERRGLKGKLTCIDEITQYRVTYEPQGNPMVSVIIPSKDNYDILKQCIESVKSRTVYGNYEIVIVDNGSSEANMKKYKELADKYGCTYFHEIKEFNFSYMCNLGASLAKGDLLLFLNDDIEIPEGQGEWMTIMAGQAQVSYTGAVGAKLIYPNTNLIQHVGVINLPIGPGHAFHRFDDSLNFYWGRNILDYNFSIVTGACLMLDRKKYEEIGRFDETFPVAYNDVELCFKLIEHGYYNVLRNDIKLVHHESVSRGYDEKPEKAARLLRERNHLYEVHPDFKGYDPCYNPNLTPDKGDFSLNVSGTAVLQHVVRKDGLNGYGFADINYAIDGIEINSGRVKISGWAFKKGHFNNNKAHVSVILQNEQKNTFFISAGKVYRPDVNAAHGKYGKLSLTGFECLFDSNEISEKGSYSVGITVGKYYVMTDKKIII